MTTITTHRLVLRPHEPADAEALLRGVGNLNVSQWAARIPYPYALSDAEAYLAQDSDTMVRCAIALKDDPGRLIGGIGYEWKTGEIPEVGYWISEPFWGRGYATEAARAMIGHAFDVGGHDALAASYQLGNEASRRILAGLGFVEIGEAESFSRARNAPTRIMQLRLEKKGRRA
jgi:RimJ/RimL family protein N-acetyltransferase